MSIKENKYFSVNYIFFSAFSGLAIGLIIGALCGYWYKSIKINESAENQNETAQTDNTVLSQYVEAETKTAQAGIITDIKGNTIYMDGDTVINNELTTQNYAVKTDKDTTVKKIDAESNADAQEEMSLADLQIGNQITALAKENFKGQTEFTAMQINYYFNN